MILIEILPGQETGNAEFVTALGAADLAETPVAMLEDLSHLLRNDQALLKERAQNAARIGQPRSAYKVAAILNDAVKDQPSHVWATRKVHRHHEEVESSADTAKWMP